MLTVALQILYAQDNDGCVSPVARKRNVMENRWPADIGSRRLVYSFVTISSTKLKR